MGKVDTTAIASGVRGKVGNLVFRRRGSAVVTSLMPRTRPDRPLSAAEVEVRARFKQASVYATTVLTDPAQLEFYTEIANEQELGGPRAAAIRDYLRPPAVESVDVSGYQGHVGDTIKVVATDDSGVTGVTLTLRTNSAVIETGPATMGVSPDAPWVYTATVAVQGQSVIVEATALDRAGNSAGRQAVRQV